MVPPDTYPSWDPRIFHRGALCACLPKKHQLTLVVSPNLTSFTLLLYRIDASCNSFFANNQGLFWSSRQLGFDSPVCLRFVYRLLTPVISPMYSSPIHRKYPGRLPFRYVARASPVRHPTEESMMHSTWQTQESIDNWIWRGLGTSLKLCPKLPLIIFDQILT